MNNFKNHTAAFLFALSILLVASCAQIVAPGGGAKDTTAPKVLKYSPDSAQLGFNSKKIEINFDEYIQLKDLNNQLIISPPLNKAPDIDVKNKTLSIEFDKNEVLKSNTTYCISFGNAVTDVNEGNPIENFKYIFSTGTFIDSLKVKGKAKTAFDHRTEKGILVMLYSDLSDSIVFKAQPDYFGKTKADGTFEINNVRSGKYKIVAIKDANANYKYDGESESIAFSDSLVDATNKKEIELELFQEPAKKIFLKKATHPSYGRFDFILSQGSDSIRINNLSNDLKGVQEYFEFSKNKDSLTYWITNYQKDSIVLQISNGNKIIDTLEFKFINKEEALKAKRNSLKLSLVNSPDGNQTYDLNRELNIYFSNPLQSGFSSENQFILRENDSLLHNHILLHDNIKSMKIGSIDSIAVEEKGKTTYSHVVSCCFSPLKESSTYSLFIPPNSLHDIFGLTNDTIKIDFKTRETKYYGSLKLNVTVPRIKIDTT
ncbi:MAG: Ig-like domain-containing protein, partial [Bacteroidia bacterium]|nr:Ig-like domain-containing protein [Bacteroidia bacterium]